MVNLPIFVSIIRPYPFSIGSCRLSRVCSGPRPFFFLSNLSRIQDSILSVRLSNRYSLVNRVSPFCKIKSNCFVSFRILSFKTLI